MRWGSNHNGWWHPNITIHEFYFVASHVILCMMGVCYYPVHMGYAFGRIGLCMYVYMYVMYEPKFNRDYNMSNFL